MENMWISVDEKLPAFMENVWIANKKGFVDIGCLVSFEDGYHWAQSNGIIYSDGIDIVSECESDDLEVDFWHPLPQLTFLETF